MNLLKKTAAGILVLVFALAGTACSKRLSLDNVTKVAEECGLEQTEDLSRILNDVSGIIVPGGFGLRGTQGMINAIAYAREHKIPFLGICFGMQMAVIETMRNLSGIKNANTTELDEKCEPVVGLMTEWNKDGAKQIRHKDGDL